MITHSCRWRTLGRLVLLLVVWALSGVMLRAQPGPDVCSVQVILVTPDGTPMPYPLGSLISVVAQQRANPGSMRVRIRNDGCTWVNLRAGPHLVKMDGPAWSVAVSQPVLLRPGVNVVTMTIPMTTLTCKLTVGGKAVAPRVIAAGYRPRDSICYPMPIEMRGDTVVFRHLLPCPAQLTLYTDVGYTATNVTMPPETPLLTLSVDLVRSTAVDFVVVDAQQHPVPGAKVVLTGLPTDNPLAQLLITADAQGYVRGLHMPPGRWRYIWDADWQAAHPEFPLFSGVCTVDAQVPQPIVLRFAAEAPVTNTRWMRKADEPGK